VEFPEKVVPPFMLYCIGAVPPVETIWMVPFARPLQVMFVAIPWLMEGPGAPATVVCNVVVQPFASVTSIAYAPCDNPAKLFDACEAPLFSE
jgi:hypothetical protein